MQSIAGESLTRTAQQLSSSDVPPSWVILVASLETRPKCRNVPPSRCRCAPDGVPDGWACALCLFTAFTTQGCGSPNHPGVPTTRGSDTSTRRGFTSLEALREAEAPGREAGDETPRGDTYLGSGNGQTRVNFGKPPCCVLALHSVHQRRSRIDAPRSCKRIETFGIHSPNEIYTNHGIVAGES